MAESIVDQAGNLSRKEPGAKSKDKYKRSVPLNFLLQCSQKDLDDIELQCLADVANLRAELQEIVDSMVDKLAQAARVKWFRDHDRDTLRRALMQDGLESLPWTGRSA